MGVAYAKRGSARKIRKTCWCKFQDVIVSHKKLFREV
jgi:hypothetical protein